MIVIDTSAVIAIVQNEPNAADIAGALSRYSAPRLMAAPTYLECCIVATRRGVRPVFETWRRRLRIVVVPFNRTLADLAAGAHERYGAGRYGLNFGDCFAYALAKSRNLPLLFDGIDFAQTDIQPAWRPPSTSS